MKDTGYIEHKGIVAGVTGDRVSINLINTSSCSSCHVKSFCNVSDVDNKIIEVSNGTGNKIKTGDRIIVNYEKTMGPRALFLGYVIPFFLVIMVLFIAMELSKNEALSGLLSLGILVPYYLSLYILRDNLKANFAFKIKTIKS